MQGDHHRLGSSELIELSNSRVQEIIATAESSLESASTEGETEGETEEEGSQQQGGGGSPNSSSGGRGSSNRFSLLPVLVFNAEMHIHVNNYMEVNPNPSRTVAHC